MSIRSLLEADMAAIFAGSDPETVIRWPQGSEGAAVSVKGFWEPDDTPNRSASQDGESTTLGGRLSVLHTVETHGEDVWVIDSLRFATDGEPVESAGLMVLRLTRIKANSESRQRNRL